MFEIGSKQKYFNENHALNNKMFIMLNSIDAWLYLKSCFVKTKIDALGEKVRKLIFEWGVGEYSTISNFINKKKEIFSISICIELLKHIPL